MLKRSSNCGVIAVEITILAFHVIFFDGAEVESFCERGLSSIFVAVAFVGVNRARVWCRMFETFGVNHVSWSNRYFVDHA